MDHPSESSQTQKDELWINTFLVVDYNRNEPNTYGPYSVAKEAELENTAACLYIGKLYFSSCRVFVTPIY